MAILSPGAYFRRLSGNAIDMEGERYGDVCPVIADGIAGLLEAAALTEFEQQIGARRYERECDGRSDYRNGTRERTVQTRVGTLKITIPRMRSQGFVPSFLEPGRRALGEIEGWVASGFLSGMSRAQVCRHLEKLTGLVPSASVLSGVQAKLDLCAKEFKERPLTDQYEYLFLDAAWVKDIAGGTAVRVCILTAVGITWEGQKQILGFERAPRENETAWRGFLLRLKERGLCASCLELVISDEHMGIVNAVAQVLGNVAHQLCWAHRMRNAVERVTKTQRKAFVDDMRQVYRAQNRRQALACWAAVKLRWRGQYPALIESIEQDMTALLAFFDRPALHRPYVRTSNPIERVFRDLRKRGYGCGAFTDRKSCDRIVFSVFHLLNDIASQKNVWQERKRLADNVATTSN